jgi:hypothetical protein
MFLNGRTFGLVEYHPIVAVQLHVVRVESRHTQILLCGSFGTV